jgi:hypothetical protein
LLFHLNLPLQCLWLLTLFLPLSITYATLRYNLFDASVIMRRSLTYGPVEWRGDPGLSVVD